MLLRRISLVAVLALGGLFVTACGDDDDGGGGGGLGGGGGGDFCDQARGLGELEGVDPTDEDAFDAALDQSREVLENAPDEIRDDVQVLLDALEAFQEGDLGSIDTEALDQASQNVDEYLADECGIEST